MSVQTSIWEWVLPLAIRLYKNEVLGAVRRSFIVVLPLILAVAAADVVVNVFLALDGPFLGENGLNLGFWIFGALGDKDIKAQEIENIFESFVIPCKNFVATGYGLVSLALVVILSRRLADIWHSEKNITSFIALAAYSFFLPQAMDEAHGLHPMLDRNFFTAIFSSIFASGIFAWLCGKKILLLKMPESLSPGIAHSLMYALPGTITVFIVAGFSVFQGAFSLFQGNWIQSLPVEMFQSPLFVVFYQTVTWFIWWIGVPGYTIAGGVHEFVYGPLLLANQIGDVAIFNSGFLEACIIHVLGLIIALLVFSRHGSWRTTAKVALFPALFNVYEPIVFGLPVVLNPLFLIPFIFAPIANTLVGYVAFLWQIVPYFQNPVPWSMPFFFSGIISADALMGGILQLVWLVMDTFIYAPFVITSNMMQLAEERDDEHNENSNG